MTYAPQTFPPGFPYAPPQVGPTAKYAGILLLILGIVSLLLGGCFGGAGLAFDSMMSLPEVQNDANLQKAMSDMKAAGADIKLVMIVAGAVFLVYAIPAIVISIVLMRARTKPPVVVGLVLVSIALIPVVVFFIAGLASANVPGVIFWALVGGVHGLVLMLITQSLRYRPTPMMMPGPHPQGGYYAPPQYSQPMQGYQYQPPSQQSPRDGTGI